MRRTSTIISTFFFAVSLGWSAEIVVPAAQAHGDPANPADKTWKKAAAVTVPLAPQTYTNPKGGGAVKTVEVKALRTDEAAYVRLSWADPTKNAELSPGGTFSDACAVEFPLDPAANPSPFMGSPRAPVNIWYWRAAAATPEKERYDQAHSDFYRSGAIHEAVKFDDSSAQNLMAEGFGTLSPAGVQDVSAQGRWSGGRWSVVFKRALKTEEGARLSGVLPIAFAVWDGNAEERNGIKSLSVWHTVVWEGAAPALADTPAGRGERVFHRMGCATCHGAGGVGGVKNRNSQGGEVPPINKVNQGFTEEEVKKVVRDGRGSSVPEDPAGPVPPLRMNSWKNVMDETELDDLVKYLWGLAPKGEDW